MRCYASVPLTKTMKKQLSKWQSNRAIENKRMLRIITELSYCPTERSNRAVENWRWKMICCWFFAVSAELNSSIVHNERYWRSTGIDAVSARCCCKLMNGNYNWNLISIAKRSTGNWRTIEKKCWEYFRPPVLPPIPMLGEGYSRNVSQ